MLGVESPTLVLLVPGSTFRSTQGIEPLTLQYCLAPPTDASCVLQAVLNVSRIESANQKANSLVKR